jgi:hypothetical protein
MGLIIALVVGGLALLAAALIPVLLAAGFLAILLHLVLLPLKLLGLGLKLGAGLAGAIFKLLLVLMGGALLILLGVGVVPLIPLLLLGVGLYLILRPSPVRPRMSA